MALTDWVQTAAAIFFAWQQNQIFKRQNQILAAQSEKTAMPIETSWAAKFKQYWPTYVMLVLIAITAYDIYDRHVTPVPVPVASRWDALADADVTRMPQLLVFVKALPRLHFEASDPYADIEITLVNASVFDLSLDGITGHAMYQRQPLPIPPQFVKEAFALRHGEVGDLVLRQFVSKQLAHNMQAAKGKIEFDFGNSMVKFKFTDRQGQGHTFDRSFNEVEIMDK